jgi:uncharacterized protein
VNTLELTLLIWLGSVLAGFLGSLTGLGGGIVLTPLLTLVFGVDIRYAIGAKSPITTTSSASPRSCGPFRGFCGARVAFSIIAFTLQRDRLYVGITSWFSPYWSSAWQEDTCKAVFSG